MIFSSRASADGRTRCRCCGRELGIDKRAVLEHNLKQHDAANYIVNMELCHVVAHSDKGPDIRVNVWPGDPICNGIMSNQMFIDFAVGRWTEGKAPADGRAHPIVTPNECTQSEEYLEDLAEFTLWHTQWKADGSPMLVVDPNDVTKHVRG